MGIIEYKTLSEKIILYNRLHSAKKQNDALHPLYDEIVFEIRLIIYHLPQQHLQLAEEDASEFLLYMEPKIDGIINNYKYISSDFLSYIYPILSKKIKSFRQAKYIKQHREDIVMKYHSLYEKLLYNQQNLSSDYASDSDLSKSLTIRRLKFIFRNHETSKKRFFIFMASLSNLLSESTIRIICKTLNFDLGETTELIGKIYDAVSCSQRQLTLTEKRNMTWLKYLFTEDSEHDNQFTDNIKTDCSKKKIYLESLNKQNMAIKERKTTISKTIIGEKLGITTSSAGLATFYMKNILNFCLNNNNCECKNLGINPSLYKALCNGTWENYPEPETEELFSPFKAFRIR